MPVDCYASCLWEDSEVNRSLYVEKVDNEMRIRAIEQGCANKRAFHRGRIGF